MPKAALHVSLLLGLWLGFCLIGCNGINQWKLKREVMALWQSSHGELQQKRALLVSEESLKLLDRIDIAVVVPQQELARFTGLVTDLLNSDAQIKDQQLSFSKTTIALRDQEISVELHFIKQLPKGHIDGSVIASGTVGVLQSGVLLSVVARDISLDDVTILPNWSRKEAVQIINAALASTLAITNAALDKAINQNPDHALVLWLDQHTLVNEDLTKRNTATLTFEPTTIITSMEVQASGILVQKEGLSILSKVSFVKPEDLPKRRVNIPELRQLLEIGKSEVSRRIAKYQNELRQRGEDAFGVAVSLHAGDGLPRIVITKEAVSRALNHGLSQIPVKATAMILDEAKGDIDLKFPIKEANCIDLVNACEFKNVCEGNRCQETVSRTVQNACKVNCCLQWGLIGCLIPGLCDGVCQSTQQVVQNISSPACDAFRAADKVTVGGLCNIASNIDKSSCDVEKNLKKSACDTQQEVRRFYEHNPFAKAEARLKPNIAVKAVLQHAEISPDLAHLAGDAIVSGSGEINAGLKYMRQLPTDAFWVPPLGLCITDWSESTILHIAGAAAPYHLVFEGQLNDDPNAGKIVVNFKLTSEPIVHVDFEPPPIKAFFGDKPHLTLNCPVAVVGSFVMGTGEAIFTPEDARQILPLWTGKAYPYHVKDLGFNIEIPKLPVCRTLDKAECDKNRLLLQPHVGDKVLIFVGRK
jgi:hypothetical protein